MSSDFDFNYEREVEQLRIAIEFHEQQIGRIENRIGELQEEGDVEDDEYLDDIFSNDKIPPQFYLDELERELDYNLGQVDGFCDLSWKSKCDLARLAVDNDLSIEECETVLDLNQGDDARGISC